MEKVLNLFTRFVKEKSLKIVFCLSNMFATTVPLGKESEMSHIIVIYKIKFCAFKHKQTYFKNRFFLLSLWMMFWHAVFVFSS